MIPCTGIEGISFLSDERNGARAHDRLPRLHHWLIAAAILFVMNIALPIFAAFI